MRDYKVTKKSGEWHSAEVTDSYGNEYQNYYETEQECIEWIYYVWSKEEWFNSRDPQKLLAEAILNCKKIDKENNRTKILWKK